ncbi:hypothetical protein C8R32_10231 [Nitrosospira sp. Nsp5]|uniref:Uncharacterized protein n=1 Tax=Nitrosospira multiformis TaxID=1231 RepID=A0ABY0TL92_9PROT|nr:MULTISPECIES: hypothetical protein [Nitrosospira]PTR09945.1 hypothetical protein C8R32_10231 [Nitrosospira sp. Nsp5]SDR00764.1 hypothetical protein SAMN05216402_3225 [Nitrosospira multiformis]
MRKSLTYFWIVLLFLTIVPLGQAQIAPPEKDKPTGSAENKMMPPTMILERIETLSKLDLINEKLIKINDHVEDTHWINPLIASLAGLIGVFLGGGINYLLQKKRLESERVGLDATMRHELALAKKRATLEITNSIVDWRLKQMSLLYGPLHALLGQSKALYCQMGDILVRIHRDQFQKVGGELQIMINPEGWKRFRTVLHISSVYGKNFGVDPYFDEIVGLGGQIVHIIEKNAGYALADQHELMSVFGCYLAHFAVLKQLHKIEKEKRESLQASQIEEKNDSDVSIAGLLVEDSAVFPQQIQVLIDDGFQKINSELENWREQITARSENG